MKKDSKKYRGSIPQNILNWLGPIGETIIDRPYYWTLNEDERTKINENSEKSIKEVWFLKDDRLLVLTAGLIVENCLDQILISFSQDFNKFIIKGNVNFSTKIKLIKAMAIIPSKFLEISNMVRKCRNEFAHDLNCRKFEDLPEKLRDFKLYFLMLNKEGYDNQSDRDNFLSLVLSLINALNVYDKSVKSFSEFIRREEFTEEIHVHYSNVKSGSNEL